VKVLDKYLTREVLSPFVLGIVGFVMVMIVDLLFTFVDLIINKGIPLGAVLQLLLYKLPSILVLTFPVATLFGVAMCLGRLSKDNELIALRTSGVTFYRIALPIIILSLLVSLASFITNEKIVPYSNQRSQEIIRKIVMKRPLPDIKEDIFFKDAYNRHFYIGKINAKTRWLDNIMVYELAGEKLPRVVTAQRAYLDKLVLTLYKGIIHKYDDNGFLAYEAEFDEMNMNLNENPLTFAHSKTPEEMTSVELKDKITQLDKSGVSTKSLKTDFYMKYSIPFTALVFALLGIPLALPGLRSGRTWGMILTIVLMFTFYVFASVFRSLGRGGILPPILAAWTPQALFGILGLILLFREGSFK